MIKYLSENHLKTRNLQSASFTRQHPGRKEGPRHSFSVLSKSLSEYRKIGRFAQNLLNSVWLCFRSNLGASEHWKSLGLTFQIFAFHSAWPTEFRWPTWGQVDSWRTPGTSFPNYMALPVTETTDIENGAEAFAKSQDS